MWYLDRQTNTVVSDALSDIDERDSRYEKMKGIRYLAGELIDWRLNLANGKFNAVLAGSGFLEHGDWRVRGMFCGADIETGVPCDFTSEYGSDGVVVLISDVPCSARALEGLPDRFPCLLQIREVVDSKEIRMIAPLGCWSIFDTVRAKQEGASIVQEYEYMLMPTINAKDMMI